MATLTYGPGGKVDPQSLRDALTARFTASPLNGFVPPDGAKFGIVTGSPDEWARFGQGVAKQESGYNPRSTNLSDPGGSYGLFQFNQHQFGLNGNAYDPAANTEAFARSMEHYVPQGGISKMGAIFGSIRRPWETTQHLPGLPPAQPGYGPEGLNEVGQDGPRNLSLLNIKAAEPSQSMMALGGPKPEGAPVADPNDDPRLQNRGGMNPLVMMGLGLLTSGMEGKDFSKGLLGGANAAQGFDSNRIQELNSERGWAIKQRELQRQQQADEWVKGFSGNGALAKILGPGIGDVLRGMPTDSAAQLVQSIIAQKQKQEADLAMMNRKMQLADDAYGGGQPQPSMQPPQMGPPQMGAAPQPPIPQIQPPQPPPAVGVGRFAAPQLGGQLPQPPQPQAGGQMDPRRVAVLEAAGILPPGAAKAITEDPNYQIAQRRKAAIANGFDLSDPSTKAYIINGKMPELIPDRKAIMEADQKVREGRKVAESLDLTSQYSKDAYSGFAAGPRAAIVNNTLPTESSKATANMDTEILTSMMPQLKAAFPGRITNNDIKLFESIQPSSGMTLDQRTKAIARAKQRVQQLVSEAQSEADQLRGGTFYRKSGGVSGGAQPPAVKPVEQHSDDELLGVLGLK